MFDFQKKASNFDSLTKEEITLLPHHHLCHACIAKISEENIFYLFSMFVITIFKRHKNAHE